MKYDLAFQTGRLAVAISDKCDNVGYRGKVHFIFGAHLNWLQVEKKCNMHLRCVLVNINIGVVIDPLAFVCMHACVCACACVRVYACACVRLRVCLRVYLRYSLIFTFVLSYCVRCPFRKTCNFCSWRCSAVWRHTTTCTPRSSRCIIRSLTFALVANLGR